MEFRVLGPLEVRCPGQVVHVQGAAQTTLLGALIARRGDWVSRRALAEELWGATQPARAENALHAHVSRLRKQLDRVTPGAGAVRVECGLSGYRLRTDPEEVDGERFCAVIDRIRRCSETAPVEATVRAVREALLDWRGPVFGGISGGPIGQAGAARYGQYRSSALETLFDAELARGNHAAIIGELNLVVESEQLPREAFWAQLMVALYRAGRQVEALHTYWRAAEVIGRATGAGPSARLRHWERAILEHSPLLRTAGLRVAAGAGGQA